MKKVMKKLTYLFALFFALFGVANALDPLGIEYIKKVEYKDGKICSYIKFTKVSLDYRETYLFIDIVKDNTLIKRFSKFYSFYPNGKLEYICFNYKLSPGVYKLRAWHKTYYCNSKGFCAWNINTISSEQFFSVKINECNEKIIDEYLISKCVVKGKNYGYSEYRVKKQLKDCSVSYQVIKKKDYDCKKNSNNNNGEGTPYQNIWPEFKVKFHVNEPLYLRAGKYASEIGRSIGFYEIEILNGNLYPYWRSTKVLIEVGFKNVDANGNPTVDPIRRLLSIWLKPKASACDGSNYFASSYVDLLNLVKSGKTKFNFLPDLKAPNKPGRYKFYFLISNGCYNSLKDKYKVLYYKEFDAIVLGNNDDSTEDVYQYYDNPDNFKRNEGSFVGNIKQDITKFFEDLKDFILNNILFFFSLFTLIVAVLVRSGIVALIALALFAIQLGIALW